MDTLNKKLDRYTCCAVKRGRVCYAKNVVKALPIHLPTIPLFSFKNRRQVTSCLSNSASMVIKRIYRLLSRKIIAIGRSFVKTSLSRTKRDDLCLSMAASRREKASV
jgi:hypothetical protein